ncbi:hypothetical protein AHAS_Ahas13G0298500 [Arachis hypogaea]
MAEQHNHPNPNLNPPSAAPSSAPAPPPLPPSFDPTRSMHVHHYEGKRKQIDWIVTKDVLGWYHQKEGVDKRPGRCISCRMSCILSGTFGTSKKMGMGRATGGSKKGYSAALQTRKKDTIGFHVHRPKCKNVK